MKMFAGSALAMASLCPNSYASNLPFIPQRVDALAPENAPPPGFSRLRLSLTKDKATVDKNVRVGNIVACSQTACYSPYAPTYVDISNTENGLSTYLLDMKIPPTSITSLHFESLPGVELVSGSLNLPEPVELTEDYPGKDILVVVKKVDTGSGSEYRPVAAGSNFIGRTQTSVYYNPVNTTVVDLPGKTRLSIPAGATASPQIFLIAVHDTGDKFSVVDIYPRITLEKPLVLETTQIEHVYRPDEEVIRVKRHSSKSRASSGPAPANSRQATLSTLQTGFLRFRDDDDISENEGERAATASLGIQACESLLLDPINRKTINEQLKPTSAIHVNWCEQSPPYVHIGIAQLSDAKQRLSMPVAQNSYRNGLPALTLNQITHWTPGSKLIINGFVWEGDPGTSKNQTGLAAGYLASNENIIADNRVGGAFSSSIPGESSGNKLVLRWNKAGTHAWLEKSDVTPLKTDEYEHHVSSSTSIVKAGVCTTDSLVNRWSAVGTTREGRLIFMSSTSSGETSAAELCGAFKALDADNAIRLDGGPSAAFAVTGKVLNPLELPYSLKYGELRYIPYGLRFTSVGS